MDAHKKATIDVRNAIFQAADGKPADAALQGIIMAMGKLAAQVCDGDETSTREVLGRYHGYLLEAVPLYCTEILTGQSRAS